MVFVSLLAMPASPAWGATSFFDAELHDTVADQGVARADLDGDGAMDIVSAGGGVVSVWLGNGQGDFSVTEYAADSATSGTPSIGDLNRDGADDVAVSSGSAVSVMSGDGDGGLGTPLELDVDGIPRGSAIGDFGGDGGLDLAVAGTDDDEIQLFLQNADGSLSAGSSLSVGDRPFDLAIADLDDNGHDDIVTGHLATPGGVSVLLQHADGFASPVAYDTAAANVGDVEIADMDDDGALDVVIAASGAVHILPGAGSGVLGSASHHGPPGGMAVDVADLDDDNDLDALVTSQPGPVTYALLQEPGGAFTTVTAGEPSSFVNFGDDALADFDQDGHADLVLASPDLNAIGVMFGDVLRVEPGFLDLGSHHVGLDVVQTVTVRNTGSALIDPGSASMLGGSSGLFSVAADGCAGKVLAVREGCDVAVRFTSGGETATHQAELMIPGSATSGPRFVPLQAEAVARERSTALMAIPSSPRFVSTRGVVSSPSDVVLRNRGFGELQLGSVAATGPFGVVGGDCAGKVLGPDATCSVRVVFRPVVAGLAQGALRVEIDSPWSYTEVRLSGSTRRSSPMRFPRPVATPPRRLTVRESLARIARSVPRLLRGGPRITKRLPRFFAPEAGRLRMRVTHGKTVVAAASGRFVVHAGRRLWLKTTRSGRKLLRRPRATRINVVVVFRPADGSRVTRRSAALRVPAPRRQ